MAEIPVGEFHTADRDAFFRDTNNQLVYRRVRDSSAIDLLTQILTALGGSPDTTSNIFNVSCSVAGTEYSQALPSGTKSFVIKARGNSRIDFAYSSGASSYLTISPGNSYSDNNFYLNQTVYFKCSKADEVVEIVAHT